MNTRVLGAWCRVLGAVLGAGCLVLVHAQERIGNGKVETASAAQGLARAARDIAGRPGVTWLGYQVPMLADNSRRLCDSRPPRVFLEPPPTFTVLARFEGGSAVRLRTTTPECDIDAGGVTVVWLSDVKPDDSVTWLAGLVADQPTSVPHREMLVTPAITAIALHAAPAAVPQLIGLARGAKNADVRRETMTWLGRSRDPQALKFLQDLLTK